MAVICFSATDEDFYSSLAQMAGDGFDDDDDDDPDEVIILFELPDCITAVIIFIY